MITHDCPNCGASLRLDGTDDLARCIICGTQIALPGRSASRVELEAERDQLIALEREDGAQIKEAKARGVADFVVPQVGCCGLYIGLFLVGSLILGTLGLKDAEPHITVVGMIAVAAALIGMVPIIWWRERRRTERVVALERERTTDRTLRDKRLREIEADLEALGE